ncbi:MAG: nitrilase-related carbon-nitrogen hydrolase [Anaerolineae bacterium]
MDSGRKTSGYLGYVWLVIGCVLFAFVGMRWNVPVAAWLAPVFLIRFFRSRERWISTLAAPLLLAVASFAKFHGGWDLSVPAEIGLSIVLAAPLLIALYVDRALTRKVSGVMGTLVYPAAYTALEFLVGLSPVGTSLSIAVTQFDVLPLIQVASVTGIWGIPFLAGWFASTANALWEGGFDVKKAARPAVAFAVTVAAVLGFGGLRLVALVPQAETVRIAGVTVEQSVDYWTEVIDQGTPEDAVRKHEAAFEALEDALFAESERAAQMGAKIIFWSEANAVIPAERKETFLERAQAFAQGHQVYFVPAMVALKYGESYGENVLAVIGPSGEVAYIYEKTKSWYPTNSDGVLHAIDTPYGRLSTAICFDMDFPSFIHQAARQDVDIMLVPAFDWEQIKSFHTQVGLLRGVENGFSVVRQVNEGLSMAIDHRGRVLAYQDFFTTPNRVMIADVPTQGVETVYGALGDWFAYAAMLFAAGVSVWAVKRKW